MRICDTDPIPQGLEKFSQGLEKDCQRHWEVTQGTWDSWDFNQIPLIRKGNERLRRRIVGKVARRLIGARDYQESLWVLEIASRHVQRTMLYPESDQRFMMEVAIKTATLANKSSNLKS